MLSIPRLTRNRARPSSSGVNPAGNRDILHPATSAIRCLEEGLEADKKRISSANGQEWQDMEIRRRSLGGEETQAVI
jgi:hypothetical protein